VRGEEVERGGRKWSEGEEVRGSQRKGRGSGAKREEVKERGEELERGERK